MSQEMQVNPDQAAVDAELARFDAQWKRDHPRELVDFDRDPVTEPANEPDGRYMSPGEGGRLIRHKLGLAGYGTARRNFIRTNPIIQEALQREVQRKAAAVRQAQEKKRAEAFIALSLIIRPQARR